jgi:uncharacterized membrane protein YoaK (UPF0700 family)
VAGWLAFLVMAIHGGYVVAKFILAAFLVVLNLASLISMMTVFAEFPISRRTH